MCATVWAVACQIKMCVFNAFFVVFFLYFMKHFTPQLGSKCTQTSAWCTHRDKAIWKLDDITPSYYRHICKHVEGVKIHFSACRCNPFHSKTTRKNKEINAFLNQKMAPTQERKCKVNRVDSPDFIGNNENQFIFFSPLNTNRIIIKEIILLNKYVQNGNW